MPDQISLPWFLAVLLAIQVALLSSTVPAETDRREAPGACLIGRG
jgi:hypothetical protein